MFTIKVFCAGQLALAEPGMTFERWRKLAPTIEPLIPGIVDRPVAIISSDPESNVVHILGSWH